jgi:hypothetical protein
LKTTSFRRYTTGVTTVLFVIVSLFGMALSARAEESASASFSEMLDESSVATLENRHAHLGGATWRVYGYREGLVGHTTANGHVIQPNDYFVALPCWCALSSKGGNEFQVRLTYKGKSLVVPVWDVGPWNTEDNYWDPPEQRTWKGLPQGVPAAQAAYFDNYNGGLDGWGRTIGSPGGIDIGDGAFYELGMTGSDWVEVTFLWLEPTRFELPPLAEPWTDIPTVWEDERPPLDRAPVISDGRFGYIWETGHSVPLEMLEYYWANGGIATYGFPISEFFREVNYDGRIRYVQYFERTILELDLSRPRAEGDPPRIFSDLLGYTTYIDPAADQPVATFEPRPHATYFPETGHTLQHGFKNYWEANGGLVVFGYPISEEWSETTADGRKVVMQVFERARLEWWPDRVGTGTEITRGLLTVELLQKRGWLGEPAG